MTKQDIIKQQAAIIEALQKEKDEAYKAMEKRALAAEALVESQKFDIEYLKMEVAMLQNKKYGVSSDNVTKQTYPDLFNYDVFNEVEANADETVTDPIDDEGKIVSFKATNKKKNLINRLDNLETKDIIHDIPEEEKTCSTCGTQLVKISESVTEKLKYIPAKIIKERHITPIYKCEQCSKVDDKSKIVSAPYELSFPKAMIDSSIVSHVIVEKFMKFVPLYRQEKFFLNNGLDISRVNMSNWVMSAYQYLEPLFNIMHQDALKNDILLMDETTVQIIKSNRTSSYIWMMNTSKYDIPIYLYFFKESREHKHAAELLNGFKGRYIQSDCYDAYDKIPGVIDCCCLAHAKRKFSDIIKISKGKYNLSETTCNEAIRFINRLYSIEKELTRKKASIEEIYETRQTKAIPILEEYKKWLEEKYQIFPEKSKVGQALYYSLNNIDNLSNYCLDGRLEPDNNKSERQAKSYVMLRKNMLFCFSETGGKASATVLSIVETAKANKLNIFEYLKYVFDNLANIDPNNVDKLRELLPYSNTLPKYLKAN